MSISIIAENFAGLWKPQDIKSFLGGCQECVVSISDVFKNQGYKVTVFLHGPTVCSTEMYNGVTYTDFSNFNVPFILNTNSTIILFKINPLPIDSRLEKVNIIFWSSDVQEKVYPDRYIKKYVCLTEYHKNRNGWKDALVIPHGIDITSLVQHRQDKEEHTMIYCSSPDRGLVKLIQDWNLIRETYPRLKLYITYGFKISKQIVGDEKPRQDEEELKKICQNADINYLGDIRKEELEKLYWKCQYWVLPLNNPDSELFCLSAVKTQFCGCIPVVYKRGALLETVGDYIEYDEFVSGNKTLTKGSQSIPIYSWDDVVQKYWKNIV